MPVASYRAQIGVSKDTVNSTIATSIAVGATSIVLQSGTGFTNSQTAFIVDGPNTEQVVISAVSTNTLTVAATTYAHSAGCYVFAQTTGSLGPTDWFPATAIEPEDQITMLKDTGLRGSAVENYGNVQGTRLGMIQFNTDVFPDLTPYMIASVTGANDFTGATPNSHAFSVKNTGTTQPTPLAIWVYNGIDYRVIAGAKCEEVLLKYDPSALFTCDSKWQGFMSGPVTGLTAASYAAGTTLPAPAWQSTASFAGSAVQRVLSAEVSIKRPVQEVFTVQGVQDQYAVWSKAQTCDGKLNLVMENNTDLNYYLSNTQPSVSLAWSNGLTGSSLRTITVQMTKCSFESAKPKITGSNGYVELESNYVALANTTDATTAGTGYAPVKVTCQNTKATGYFG